MSAQYRVLLESTAWSQIMAMDAKTQSRVVETIELLEQNARPSGVVKLAGSNDLYRVRVSDYRIVYQIQDSKLIVLIIKVGHRRDVYRER